MTACTGAASAVAPAGSNRADRAQPPRPPASGRTRGRRAGCRRPTRSAARKPRRERGLAEQLRVEGGDVRVVHRPSDIDIAPGDAPVQSARVPQLRPGGRDHQQRHARTDAPSISTKRSIASSAQCMSSKTSTVGPRRPSPAGTAARPTRSRPGSAARRPGRPAGRSASASRAASRGAGRSPQRGVSRARAVRPSSVSRMPACGLDDLGQRGVGDVLAERRAAAGPPGDRGRGAGSACRDSSRSSRLLPMPAGPKTVTSWAVRSSTCGAGR